MDREYTIHEHNGIRFINLSKNDIITKDGDTYPCEVVEYVITNETRDDYGYIYSTPVSIKFRSALMFNIEPDNVSASHVYHESMTFTELLHLPHPGELEWIKSLPEDVLVIAGPKICHTYGYPVCMFRTKRDEHGVNYHIPEAVVWSKTP